MRVNEPNLEERKVEGFLEAVTFKMRLEQSVRNSQVMVRTDL